MAAKDISRERLSQGIGIIVCGRAVADDNVTGRTQLANLEVTAMNVARTLTRLQIFGKLNGAGVVHVQRSRCGGGALFVIKKALLLSEYTYSDVF